MNEEMINNNELKILTQTIVMIKIYSIWRMKIWILFLKELQTYIERSIIMSATI